MLGDVVDCDVACIGACARWKLEAAIREFIAAHNAGAKPFIWNKTADEILASIARFAQRTLNVKQAPGHMSRTIGTGH